jgi:hypothetical protein
MSAECADEDAETDMEKERSVRGLITGNPLLQRGSELSHLNVYGKRGRVLFG